MVVINESYRIVHELPFACRVPGRRYRAVAAVERRFDCTQMTALAGRFWNASPQPRIEADTDRCLPPMKEYRRTAGSSTFGMKTRMECDCRRLVDSDF